MTIVEAILFGAVQGATEFLPVSSSGHLAVLKSILDLSEVPVLFDVLLHVATLIVVIFIFRARVGGIIVSLGRWITRRSDEHDAENLRLTWVILVATLVTGVLGIALNGLDIAPQPKIVSALFIVTGIVLIGARFLRGSRDYSTIGLKDGLVVGLGQAVGVLPGISRSGITISAALASGLNREKAGEFAFLVALPAILGALVLSLRDSAELATVVSVGAVIVGFVAALVVGFVSLKLLIRLIKGGHLFYFSFYLIPLGILGILFL